MGTKSGTGTRDNSGASLYGLYLAAMSVSGAGNLLIRIGEEAGWLPGWGQVALAVLASLPLVAAAVVFGRMLRRELDEMLQRVVLEGIAFALIVYLPLAALYSNLRTAGVRVPHLDPPDLLMGPALLVAIGIAIAWRRYR